MVRKDFNLWRINLKPTGENNSDVKKYCFDEGYITMGWRINSNKSNFDYDNYINECKKNNQWSGFESASKSYKEIEKGDLCIARDNSGIYYVGLVKGKLFYATDKRISKASEYCFSWTRKVKWYPIGKQSDTPSIIVGVMSEAKQGTINKRNDIKLKEMVKFVYEILARLKTSTQIQKRKLEIKDFPECISAESLEVIVGLFLQENYGYIYYPKSGMKTTMLFEYILIDRKTLGYVYVQVKQNAKIDLSKFDNYKNDKVYVYSNKGYDNDNLNYKHVNKISKEKLFDYFKNNNQLLTNSLKYEKMLYDF